MWCFILWLLGFRTILIHCLLPLTIIISIISYKVYSYLNPSSRPHLQLSRNHISLVLKGKLREMARRSNPSRHNPHIALAVLLILLSSMMVERVRSLEQDAKIIEPFADLAKSFISTATEGKPLEINITATDLLKSIGSFAWRSKGIPVAALRDFFGKVQDFYNDIRTRVDLTEVQNIERKTLVSLKQDLDSIVDAIVEEVRVSPDGLFTDYLKVNVNGRMLEDACTAVGVQLKAYGIDLTNYRNIAGAVLGVPLMPQVASSVVSVAKLAPDVTGRVTNGVSTLTSATSAGLTGVRDMATKFIPY